LIFHKPLLEVNKTRYTPIGEADVGSPVTQRLRASSAGITKLTQSCLSILERTQSKKVKAHGSGSLMVRHLQRLELTAVSLIYVRRLAQTMTSLLRFKDGMLSSTLGITGTEASLAGEAGTETSSQPLSGRLDAFCGASLETPTSGWSQKAAAADVDETMRAVLLQMEKASFGRPRIKVQSAILAQMY
jgi:hypothetical protein